MTTAPQRLMVEHLVDPVGVDWARPRLSWWLPDGATRQDAYRLQVGDWDSGRVEGPDHLLVASGAPPATARQRVDWRVRVWSDLGESDWSPWAHWEVGLLDEADWVAGWIEPHEPDRAAAGSRPAHLLRREFVIDGPVARARVYATAHGLYELFLNGHRVGDVELAPGTTAYRSQLDVQAYDVTDLLVPGDNAIGAVLSDGWWRGKAGFTREVDCFGSTLALLTQLEVELGDGSRQVVATGDGWTSGTGAVVRADLIDGQGTDLGQEADGWARAGFDDSGWSSASPTGDPLGPLTASPAPPVRRIEELTPISVTTVVGGEQVVDLGQNINGWVRLADLGPAGTSITLVHGEMLDAAGAVTTDHLAPFDFVTQQPLPAGQVDTVVSRGHDDDVVEPRHTTKGFQYVGVTGHPGGLTADDVTGVVVHTDLVRTGWFTCDDERLQRLHDAAVWSFRGNACDVPTDCPQRERAGWTGDWQLFCPTAAFLFDVAGFSAKWLRDLRADQWPDGRVPNFLPDPHGPAGHDNDIAAFMTGSAGWGDAAVIVPWEMWVEYADDRFLADGFDAMERWVGFAAERARTGRHGSRVAARPDPAPHEEYLWDSGFHWGEWCEPGGNPEEVFTLEQDMGDVATAFLVRSASLLSAAARVLGRPAEEDRYAALAASCRAAWQAEYLDDDGRLQPRSQANHVRALAFGLVPDDLRASVAADLVTLVEEAGDHLSTGFLATPDLLPVLADTGHLDVAYRLLYQDTPPSWLAMIDRGATTIWESWEGIDAQDGVGSLNHYSKGAVISFLHRHVGGLRPDPAHPGYERFTIRPCPGGGITRAEVTHDARRGRIRSSWTLRGDQLDLEVEVPAGAEAEVVLPDGRVERAGPGVSSYRSVVVGR